MVQKYLDKLSKIVEAALPADFSRVNLRCKHFFTGAAAYVHNKIFCTYTPSGIAIKLSLEEREKLLKLEKGSELRYFPNAPVKKEYIILNRKIIENIEELHYWIKIAMNYVISKID